jgi:ElaB/YqjD/DUF883 family membrane-anchored ribosome-binding protein
LLKRVAEDAKMAKANGRRGVSDATHDVQQDLQALREDLGALAEEVTGLMSSTGNQALDEVKDRVRRIRSGLDDVMSNASARGRDALHDAGENLGAALEEHIKERPLTTLALAVGLGFILGASWRK